MVSHSVQAPVVVDDQDLARGKGGVVPDLGGQRRRVASTSTYAWISCSCSSHRDSRGMGWASSATRRIIRPPRVHSVGFAEVHQPVVDVDDDVGSVPV